MAASPFAFVLLSDFTQRQLTIISNHDFVNTRLCGTCKGQFVSCSIKLNRYNRSGHSYCISRIRKTRFQHIRISRGCASKDDLSNLTATSNRYRCSTICIESVVITILSSDRRRALSVCESNIPASPRNTGIIRCLCACTTENAHRCYNRLSCFSARGNILATCIAHIVTVSITMPHRICFVRIIGIAASAGVCSIAAFSTGRIRHIGRVFMYIGFG